MHNVIWLSTCNRIQLWHEPVCLNTPSYHHLSPSIRLQQDCLKLQRPLPLLSALLLASDARQCQLVGALAALLFSSLLWLLRGELLLWLHLLLMKVCCWLHPSELYCCVLLLLLLAAMHRRLHVVLCQTALLMVLTVFESILQVHRRNTISFCGHSTI